MGCLSGSSAKVWWADTRVTDGATGGAREPHARLSENLMRSGQARGTGSSLVRDGSDADDAKPVRPRCERQRSIVCRDDELLLIGFAPHLGRRELDGVQRA